jgi:hypothetical protein
MSATLVLKMAVNGSAQKLDPIDAPQKQLRVKRPGDPPIRDVQALHRAPWASLLAPTDRLSGADKPGLAESPDSSANARHRWLPCSLSVATG